MLLVLASRVQSFGFKLLGENKLSLVSTRDCLLDTESRSHIDRTELSRRGFRLPWLQGHEHDGAELCGFGAAKEQRAVMISKT